MTTPSITFSKKVIEELLEIQDDIEDASKLSNKVIFDMQFKPSK